MQPEHRHTVGARLRDLTEQVVEMVDRVGQPWQNGRDHHVTVQAGLTDRGDQTEPGLR